MVPATEGRVRSERSAVRPVAFVMAVAMAISALYLLLWIVSPRLTGGGGASDLIFVIDAARRMAQGQIPHVDFWLSTGVLVYALFRASELLMPAVPAYIGMHFLVFLLLLPYVAVASGRMKSTLAGLCLLAFVAIGALLPFNTVVSSDCTTDLYGTYNRFGGIFAVAWLAWLFNADPSARSTPVLAALGALFAFSMKIVFVGVVVGPLAALFLLDRRWRLPALIGAALTIAVLAAFELKWGMVSAYLRDLREMSAINGNRIVYFVVSFAVKNLAQSVAAGVLVLVLLWEAWLARPWKQPGSGKLGFAAFEGFAPPLAAALALAGLLVAESQSTGGLGLTGALGLLFIPGLFRSPISPLRALGAGAVIFVIGGSLVGNAVHKGTCNLMQQRGAPVTPDWASRFVPYLGVPGQMAAIAEGREELWTTDAALTASIMAEGKELRAEQDDFMVLAQWKSVSDAIRVLEQRHEVGTLGRVTTISFVDLFGVALDAPAPKGVKIVLDTYRTLVPMNEAETSAYLRNVDTVFFPTCVLDEEVRGRGELQHSFLPVLVHEFTPEVLTPCWTMYRRKAG